MDNVHYEKKQLVALWKSSLVHLQQKDEALQQIEQSLRNQEQRVAELENERHAVSKQLSKTQVLCECRDYLLHRKQESVGVQREHGDRDRQDSERC